MAQLWKQMSKTILRGKAAREALKRGVDLAADCVKVTLGPAGRNAVLGRTGITPIITNDGVTIAHHIQADNEIEQLGVMAVKEASMLTDIKAGDGTTTTTVLLQAILEEAFKRLDNGGSLIGNKENTILLKKEIDSACASVVEALKSKKKDVVDVYDAALVSGEFEWIANIVSEIYKQIGKDGYVSLERGIRTAYEVLKGMEIPVGLPSEYYINNDKKECVLSDVKILVTNHRLDVSSVTPLLESITSVKGIKNLVIVAPEFTRDLLNGLAATKVKTGFYIVPLKLPTYDKDDVLIDITTFAGGSFVDKNTLTSIADLTKQITPQSLGSLDKIVIGLDSTIMVGGKGDVTERVEALKKEFEETKSQFDKDKLEKRIASLTGGVAVVKVGAESEFEQEYFYKKMEDALNAGRTALRDGVVPGGGLALKSISETMSTNILTPALLIPYKQIQENAGGSLEIGDKIVDPLMTVVHSLQNACSLAGMLLTTEVAVADKEEDKTKNHDRP